MSIEADSRPSSLPPQNGPLTGGVVARAVGAVGEFFREAFALLKREPLWATFIVAYLIAWSVPLIWCWEVWGISSNAPLAFQPCMALLFILLLWSRRAQLTHIHVRLARQHSSTSTRRRGNGIIFTLGCSVFLFGCCIQVKGVSVIGLLLIALGAAYWSFGPVLTKAMTLPFVFLALMIPPPDTAIDRAAILLLGITVKLSKAVLSVLHHPVALTVSPLHDIWVLQGQGEPVTLRLHFNDGLGNILCTMAFLAGYCALRRVRPMVSLSLIALGGVLGYILNLLRTIAAVLVNGASHTLSNVLLIANGFVIAAIAAYLSVLFMRRLIRISIKTPTLSVSAATDVKRGLDRAATPVADGIAYVGRFAWQKWTLGERGIESLLRRLFPQRKRGSSSHHRNP